MNNIDHELSKTFWNFFRVLIILTTALIVVLTAFPASTQIPQTVQKQEDPENPRGFDVSQPIPASQISIKAEETVEVIRALRNRPVLDLEIDAIRKKIPGVIGEYQELREATENAFVKGLSTRMLQDLERSWNRAADRIASWKSLVKRDAVAFERDLQTLQELRRAWDATLAAADEAGLQQALVEVARNSKQSVTELEKLFGERHTELLTIEEQIRRADEIVRDALSLIEMGRTNITSQLRHLETQPLWTVLVNLPPRTQHLEHLRTVWKEGKADLYEFVIENENQLIVYGLISIVLISLFIALHRRLRHLELDLPQLEIARRILTRPIESALFLIIVFIFILYPNAPRIVDDLLTIFFLIPLFRILPRDRLGKPTEWIITFVVLVVFGRFVEVLIHLSTLQRIALLLLTTVAIIAVSRLVHIGTPSADAGKSLWARFARPVRRYTLFLLIIAIVANIIGDVTLAMVLTNAIIISAYLTLIIYMLYLILESGLWIVLRSSFAKRLHMVEHHEEVIRKRALLLLRIGLAVYWTVHVIDYFQITPVVLNILRVVLTAEARFGDFGVSLQDLLTFVITVWAALLISRFIQFVLNEDVYPRLRFPRGFPHAISTGIHYIILLFGFFLAVAGTGVDLTKFTILVGAFGVGIGFGLQNVVNNFVSGLILILERPIMPGDTIQMGEFMGEVKRIGMRSSTVRTWEGAEVIVPNGNLISSDVINWTLSDRQRRIDINIGVAYGTDTTKVVDILAEAGASHPEVLKHPEPYVLFLGFGDSSLNFQLRVWTMRFERYVRIRSDITLAVEKALKESGIVIPFPQRDLHIKSDVRDTRDNKDI